MDKGLVCLDARRSGGPRGKLFRVPTATSGRVLVSRWREPMTRVGHKAALPDLPVSFMRWTDRQVTFDGHPQSTRSRPNPRLTRSPLVN
jgi:hypothetical protein